MYEKNNVEKRCHKILEDNGGFIADKARTILLEDPALSDLRPPLEFISKNWRDPLTPALMSLSCEAVGGRSDETHEVALAMSLMNLSFFIWDDILDKASLKLFKPTLFGKFGEGTALIVGGLASAKAFSILNQTKFDHAKQQIISSLLWDLWAKIAKAETASLSSRNSENHSSKKKLEKIKAESIDIETCLKIGGIMGNGSEREIRHLGKYGRYLGIILELWKDFHVSVNLTLELHEKIRSGALPYSLLWARERSAKIQKKLGNLSSKNTAEETYIKEIVEDILEIKTLDNTVKNIRRFAKKGGRELIELNRNSATRTLQWFIEAQPLLFIKSLSALQANES
jgi:geranylgeranyl pyrophosphate synthase